jgi:hypothetical protein
MNKRFVSSGVSTLSSASDVVPILDWNLMDETREMTMAGIKDEIAQGEYTVDARAVAEAIVRHLRAVAAANAERLRPPAQVVNDDFR